jgi:hypothetical protein
MSLSRSRQPGSLAEPVQQKPQDPVWPFAALPLGHMGQALVREADRRAIAARMAGLDCPLGANPGLGFECRLSDAGTGADVALCFYSRRGNKEAISMLRVPPAVAATPGWQRLQRFLAAAAADRAGLWDRIDNLWLEFDVVAPLSPCPVFFFMPVARGAVGGSAAGGPWDERQPILAALLHLLPGGADHGRARILSACLDAFRAPDRHMLVGLMLGRGTNICRLCLRMADLDAAAAYLARIPAPGQLVLLDALRRELGGLPPAAVMVDLDIDDGTLAPRLSVNIRAGSGTCREGSGEAALLERLVALGLCAPEKRDALLAYAGASYLAAAPETWPKAMVDRWESSGGDETPVCVRRLHHIKISGAAAGSWSVKAYLAADYRRYRLPQPDL